MILGNRVTKLLTRYKTIKAKPNVSRNSIKIVTVEYLLFPSIEWYNMLLRPSLKCVITYNYTRNPIPNFYEKRGEIEFSLQVHKMRHIISYIGLSFNEIKINWDGTKRIYIYFTLVFCCSNSSFFFRLCATSVEASFLESITLKNFLWD